MSLQVSPGLSLLLSSLAGSSTLKASEGGHFLLHGMWILAAGSMEVPAPPNWPKSGPYAAYTLYFGILGHYFFAL